MFVPYGRIYDLDAYRGLLGIEACVGAKHSSLDRVPEWERLAVRDEARPDFMVLTGNDLAIDMVIYGSDYLLGAEYLRTRQVRRPGPHVGHRRPRVLRVERPAAGTGRLHVSGSPCPPTAMMRRCSSNSGAGSVPAGFPMASPCARMATSTCFRDIAQRLGVVA